MNAVQRLFAAVARWMSYAGALALLVMVLLVTIATVMRYFIGRPFGFTEELVALFYMSMVFLAIPLVTLNRTHVAVSVLPQRLQRAWSGVLRAGAGLAMIVFCTWFTIEAYVWMDRSRQLHSKSEQADFLLWPWMAVIPVTMAFVTLIAVFLLFRREPSPEDADESEGKGGSLPLGDGL
jgi:TRAP-type C4-dicarboxylate transport system permease small subunit